MGRCGVLALLVLLVAGCGEQAEPTAGALLEAADGFFRAGDDAVFQARTESTFDLERDGHAEAAEAWRKAAVRYRGAFRLIDPGVESRDRRAMIAFRAARAFAKAGEYGAEAGARDARGRTALFWFGQALRLAPDMRQVWYERGTLHESDIAAVRDLVRAHAAYVRYVEALDGVDPLPEAEQARADHARERVRVLAPPDGD